MNADYVATVLLDWAESTLSEIQGTYPFTPHHKDKGLPDVVAEVLITRTAVDDPAFPFSMIQQKEVEIFECGLSFMVDNTDPPAAATLLRSFRDRLQAEALKDVTLGGRVFMRSANLTFNFDTPLVRYEDGTIGREMTMGILVGDLVDVQEA